MLYWIRFWTCEPFVDAHVWQGYEDSKGRPRLEEHVGSGLVLRTLSRTFRNDGMTCEPDGDEYSIELEFPDDAAVIAFADAFNELQLDPWRIDWISREGNPEVYIY